MDVRRFCNGKSQVNTLYPLLFNALVPFILLHEKRPQFDWLRVVVFQLNVGCVFLGKSKSGFPNPKTDFSFFGQIQNQIINP